MHRAVNGYQSAMFAVDAHTKFVFVEYTKTKEKREQAEAVARIIGRFNALVDSGCDDEGKPHPKPAVTICRSDHECAVSSSLLRVFGVQRAR